MTSIPHTPCRPRRRPSIVRAGFTLIEILVAAAIGAIAIGGAFAFAKYQITSYRTQGEIANMNSGANIVFEAMIRDIRSAAFGSSFYAGATPQAFNGRLVLLDGAVARGVPGLMAMNRVTTGAAMVGSDAITVLRVEGDATHIPSSGAGVVNIPAVPGSGPGTTYQVQDPNVLRVCANRDIDGDAINDGGR